MKPWDQALKDAVVSGGAASFLSTLALGVASKVEAGHAPAALNSTSHWLWGDQRAITDEVSMRHTGVGVATHRPHSRPGWARPQLLARSTTRSRRAG